MAEVAGAFPIRVGISACLLGQRVRYDATHRYDANLVEPLGRIFDLIPVCPEVAIGMGVPREPIYLVGNPAAPRAVGTRTPALDVTDALTNYGRRMTQELKDICGYIFKARSPSCGMERVKVYSSADSTMHLPLECGVGLYAQALMLDRPLLPMAEDEPLRDIAFRENFIARVIAFHGRTADVGEN
ncbi:hypothetical protein CCP3SC15_370017 [Gammaproteobacteria bacterium]